MPVTLSECVLTACTLQSFTTKNLTRVRIVYIVTVLNRNTLLETSQHLKTNVELEIKSNLGNFRYVSTLRHSSVTDGWFAAAHLVVQRDHSIFQSFSLDDLQVLLAI
jgi:hypothetical protein